MSVPTRKRPYKSIEDRAVESKERHIVSPLIDSTRPHNADEIQDIAVLQKILEYLISQRSENDDAVQNQDASSVNSTSNETSEQSVISNYLPNIENENAIPNLINNILKEHYPTTKEKDASALRGDKSTAMTINQKTLLTQLLIAVTTEFAEPHFVRSCLQQQLSQHTSSKKIKTAQTSTPPVKSSPQSNCSSSIEFSKKAIAWTSSCLSRMVTSGSTHIAKLDGLLAATGENDGAKFEETMQQSLLCGLMGARSTEFGNIRAFGSGSETG